MGKRNYNGIDLIKFFMALCVVVIHLTPFSMFGEEIGFLFNIVLTRAAVPFFFCASGFFLRMKLDRAQNNKEFTRYAAVFAKRILMLYLVWTVIYLPCIIFWLRADGETILSFLQKCIFDGSYLHLWYLPSVAFAGVIAAIIVKRLGTIKGLVVAGILYIVGLLDTSYFRLSQMFGMEKVIELYDDIFITTRNGLFFGLIFVLLGFLAYERKEKLNNSVILLVLSLAGLVVEMYVLRGSGIARSYEGGLCTVPVVYFLFQVAKEVKLKESKIYQNMRAMGVLIYLSHCWVDFTYSVLCYNILHKMFNNMVRFGYTLVITIILSVIILKLQEKDKFIYLKKLY